MAIIQINYSSDGENNGGFVLLFKITTASCCVLDMAFA